MKLSKIIDILEDKFPLKNSENWDNVGLILGDRSKEIKKIQISLDVTEKVVEKAVEDSVDLIISHHPLIFREIKKINSDFLLGRKILKLISNNVAVYSMHTNLDASLGGLNDFIGEKLNLFKGEIIDSGEDKENPSGIGRFYKLENKISLDDLIKKIKENLNLNKVRVSGKYLKNEVSKIAIVNGSGSDYWRKAKKMGAQVLITGDLKYHEALDAREENMIIIDVGHYESEYFFGEIIEKEIKKLEEIEINIYNDERVLEIY